jgi:hypothetical protein
VLAPRIPGVLVAAVVAVALLAAPTAYAVETAATVHTGALPSAGPAASVAGFGAGRGGDSVGSVQAVRAPAAWVAPHPAARAGPRRAFQRVRPAVSAVARAGSGVPAR